MNKAALAFLLFTCCVLVSSCGTHGKIEWFPFNVPQDSIEKIIANIAGNDSIYFLPNDRTESKDIYIRNRSHFNIFTYRFYGDSAIYWNNDKNQSCIALIYVKDGAVFKNEADLNSSEKELAIKIFNEHFVALIRQQLRTPQ